MIIYKYLDEKGGLATIKNNSVLLNIPLKYNDPFDCEGNVSDEESSRSFELFLNYQLFKGMYDYFVRHDLKAKRFKSLAETFKKYLPVAGSEIKKTKKYILQAYLKPCRPLICKHLGKTMPVLKKEFKQVMKDSFSKLRKRVVISCFGSSFDSILMWSHYANMHKGVCIEFEIEDKDFKTVEYSKQMPDFRLHDTLEILFGHEFVGEEIDFNNEEYDFMNKPLLTKSEDWIYEGEIRCVYSIKKLDPKIKKVGKKWKKKLLLEMPPIKAVYVGCNATDAFTNKIKRMTDAPTYKMKKKDGEYGLTPEKI
ncbi:MAG: DUF2971 domain-containing protein [Bacilli bacterium]|nr:DUF2971 domain-containing protein [Bacilli bacterium]